MDFSIPDLVSSQFTECIELVVAQLLLGNCGRFTGNNKVENRDVQLCGTAWLHPEIPFCTQTGLLLLKRTDNTTNNSLAPR